MFNRLLLTAAAFACNFFPACNFQPIYKLQPVCKQANEPVFFHIHCCRLGPPAGRQLVLFVDDMNLPERQQYGAQPPLEMLRLLLDRGGLYDRCVTCMYWCVLLHYV